MIITHVYDDGNKVQVSIEEKVFRFPIDKEGKIIMSYEQLQEIFQLHVKMVHQARHFAQKSE